MYDVAFDTVKDIRTKLLVRHLKAGFVSSQKELARKDATSQLRQKVGTMESTNKKRKHHTPIKRGKAGEPVPSRQKEPAVANVKDAGPPIPSTQQQRVTVK